jgi:LacI family transcriptional regulator
MLGISDALQDTDYHLIVMPEGTDANRIKALRHVVEELADGVVITHTMPDDARVRYLQQAPLPFVTHGRTRITPEHAYVDFANERYAADAVHALYAQGRRRSAILLPGPAAPFGTFRQAVFAGPAPPTGWRAGWCRTWISTRARKKSTSGRARMHAALTAWC